MCTPNPSVLPPPVFPEPPSFFLPNSTPEPDIDRPAQRSNPTSRKWDHGFHALCPRAVDGMGWSFPKLHILGEMDIHVLHKTSEKSNCRNMHDALIPERWARFFIRPLQACLGVLCAPNWERTLLLLSFVTERLKKRFEVFDELG